MEHTPYSGNGTAPQAREVAAVQSTSPTRSPIVYREGPPLYVADVHVTCPDGIDPDSLTWADWHGDTDLYAAAYGAVVDVDDALFERCRFSQLGDGVSINARRPVLRQCWFDDLHDDAVELDSKRSATIDGCVLDGVHVGFSSRSSIDRDPGEVVSITDTMVRLRPQVQSYKPWKYNDARRLEECPADWPEGWEPIDPQGQHGPFFKVDPDVAYHLDQVWLYAEQEASYGGNLGPPPVCTGTTVHLCGTGAWSADSVAAWHQLAESGAITELDVTSASAWKAQLAVVRLTHPA